LTEQLAEENGPGSRDQILRLGLKSGELKREAAFRWSGDETQARRVQEEQAHHYLRWSFFAAVGAVIAGLIAEGLTLLH
jgi:hypothetical protein